jgi:hypothetical protein
MITHEKANMINTDATSAIAIKDFTINASHVNHMTRVYVMNKFA